MSASTWFVIVSIETVAEEEEILFSVTDKHNKTQSIISIVEACLHVTSDTP